MAPKMTSAVALACFLAHTAWAARKTTTASMGRSDAGEAAVEPAFDSKKMARRLCIQSRAAEWPKFFEKMTLKPLPVPADEKKYLARLLGERWQVKDDFNIKKKENGKLHVLKRGWGWLGGKTETGTLFDKLKEYDRDIKTLHKFDYVAAKAICEKGWTDEVRLCMENAAKNTEDVQGNFAKEVSEMQDIEEWAEMQWDIEEDMYTANQNTTLANLKSSIESHGFSISTTRKQCIEEAGKKYDEFSAHVAQQLSVVTKAQLSRGSRQVFDNQTRRFVENNKGALCVENEGAFCPEGTAPEEKRRFDEVKGAVWGTGGAASAKVMSILVGGVVGFLIGGPPGFAGGAAIGSAIGYPMAAIGGAAGAYYGGTGPLACSCFPNECEFDRTLNVCAIGHVKGMNPSRNPLSATLPEQSFKCALVKDKPGVCALQPCAGADFQPSLKVTLKPWSNATSSELSAGSLFGTVGQRGQDLLNCVSTDGQATGALGLATTLPDGQSNTAMAREKMLLAAAQKAAASKAD